MTTTPATEMTTTLPTPETILDLANQCREMTGMQPIGGYFLNEGESDGWDGDDPRWDQPPTCGCLVGIFHVAFSRDPDDGTLPALRDLLADGVVTPVAEALGVDRSFVWNLTEGFDDGLAGKELLGTRKTYYDHDVAFRAAFDAGFLVGQTWRTDAVANTL